MRAKFGPLAVVLLFVLSFCGCKSGSNMFASWGKKKSASSLSEAPAYKPSNPALPSAGQIPASIASTPGANLSAPATGSTTPSSAASGGYSATPAGYQQTPYPTTPFGATKVGATAGAPPTSSMANAPSSSPALASTSASAPATGYAAAVGTGNAIPPAAGYKFGAANASNSLQPQNGFYNPAYGGAGSSSTPPPYAATANANPAYNYGAPAASTAAAMSAGSPSAAAQGSQIRVADVRGGATVAPSAQVAMTSAAPPAAVMSNPTMTSAPNQASSNMVGDRYSNFAAGGATATAVAAPLASAPPVTAAAAPTNVDTREMPSTSNENYRPSAETSGGSGAFSAGASSAAPAAEPAPNESPLRKDPGYRPGGTSDYAPGGNTLRPGSSDGNGQSSSQPASRPAGGVTQASYQASPPANAPPVAVAAAARASDDRYKDFQPSPSAEPAYGASSPALSQQGAYPDHSW